MSSPVAGFSALAGICGGDLKGGGVVAVSIEPLREEEEGSETVLASVRSLICEARNHGPRNSKIVELTCAQLAELCMGPIVHPALLETLGNTFDKRAKARISRRYAYIFNNVRHGYATFSSVRLSSRCWTIDSTSLRLHNVECCNAAMR